MRPGIGKLVRMKEAQGETHANYFTPALCPRKSQAIPICLRSGKADQERMHTRAGSENKKAFMWLEYGFMWQVMRLEDTSQPSSHLKLENRSEARSWRAFWTLLQSWNITIKPKKTPVPFIPWLTTVDSRPDIQVSQTPAMYFSCYET